MLTFIGNCEWKTSYRDLLREQSALARSPAFLALDNTVSPSYIHACERPLVLWQERKVPGFAGDSHKKFKSYQP